MKQRLLTVLIVVSLLICAVFLLMNPISYLINRIYSNGVIEVYDNKVSTIGDSEVDELLKAARLYNENLTENVSIVDAFSDKSFNTDDNYADILNITGDGVMGTVSVPSADIQLPIYHGISEKEYEKGAVHLAQTSFPIGGESTHAVISAHTAFPGKIFFDKLTDVTVGEFVYIKILNHTYAYKVIEINVVLPNETDKLKIVKGKDLVTLVTCTPYSVNTHRLLVMGKRDMNEEYRIAHEGIAEDSRSDYSLWRVYFIIFIIIAVFLSGCILYHSRRIKSRKDVTNEKV